MSCCDGGLVVGQWLCWWVSRRVVGSVGGSVCEVIS